MAEPKTPPPPTDAELDVYIKTRYALLGIDISVLPADDAKAPMDQKRLLANGRDILRQEVVAADFVIDPQFHLPMPYVAQFAAWAEES
jgi:hypothetical protein